MNNAVDAAQAAFPAWSALSPQQRGAPLKKLAEMHIAEKDELARLDAIAMGNLSVRMVSMSTMQSRSTITSLKQRIRKATLA